MVAARVVVLADGKVCMSLLGTWHGGDEASKWNPASSSLFQILLSVQGMVFVEVRAKGMNKKYEKMPALALAMAHTAQHSTGIVD